MTPARRRDLGWVVAAVLAAGCGRFGFAGSELGDGVTVDADPLAPDAPPGVVDGAPDATPDAAPPMNLVFVTSTSQSVCSSDLTAADAVCAARATAAGLPGTYVAWMSTPTIDAVERLGSARGWVRVDGRPFVDTIDDLLNGRVYFPPKLDELGADVGQTFTQSATEANGTYSTSNGCSIGGQPSNGGFGWGSGVVIGSGRLHCFGIDHANPVVFAPSEGRIAFVSNGTFTPSTGLAGADAVCAADAAAQSLPGTYRAFLATSTASAASRFDLGGPIWVRTDGVPVVAAAADIATWTMLAPIERRADGGVSQNLAWTGNNVATPSLASTCNDWTSAAPQGRTTFADESAFYGGGFDLACSNAFPVFCLQQ